MWHAKYMGSIWHTHTTMQNMTTGLNDCDSHISKADFFLKISISFCVVHVETLDLIVTVLYEGILLQMQRSSAGIIRLILPVCFLLQWKLDIAVSIGQFDNSVTIVLTEKIATLFENRAEKIAILVQHSGEFESYSLPTGCKVRRRGITYYDNSRQMSSKISIKGKELAKKKASSKTSLQLSR